ncbi:hypothetical protein GCM10010510_31750 [Streptomyces anandii JCM 4720]|nr:hypothetical protein GCM10010510_31750 [Streptomyces anandii JCM 4720]
MLEEVGGRVLRRDLDVTPLAVLVLLALFLPDLLPLGTLAQAGLLVAERGQVRDVLGLDDGGKDGGQRYVLLAEVTVGVEVGNGPYIVVVAEGVGELEDRERTR